jgi:hypothetical protein
VLLIDLDGAVRHLLQSIRGRPTGSFLSELKWDSGPFMSTVTDLAVHWIWRLHTDLVSLLAYRLRRIA